MPAEVLMPAPVIQRMRFEATMEATTVLSWRAS
jgi:hypothetical protein